MKKSESLSCSEVNIHLLKLTDVWDGFIKHVLKLMSKTESEIVERAMCLCLKWLELVETPCLSAHLCTHSLTHTVTHSHKHTHTRTVMAHNCCFVTFPHREGDFSSRRFMWCYKWSFNKVKYIFIATSWKWKPFKQETAEQKQNKGFLKLIQSPTNLQNLLKVLWYDNFFYIYGPPL